MMGLQPKRNNVITDYLRGEEEKNSINTKNLCHKAVLYIKSTSFLCQHFSNIPPIIKMLEAKYIQSGAPSIVVT